MTTTDRAAMMATQEPHKSFWSTAAGAVTAIAAFVTAIATLIGALAAAGVFTPEPPAPEPIVSVGPAPEPDDPEPADPEPQEPERVPVDLVYAGDVYGCNLQFTVDIGGQTAHPVGSRFTIRNVATGAQSYSVRGTISCATIGTCTARGSGVVDVARGAEYAVTWLSTAVGACDVTLEG